MSPYYDDPPTWSELDGLGTYTCPTCKGTRKVNRWNPCSPPEPCPQCVDEDEGA